MVSVQAEMKVGLHMITELHATLFDSIRGQEEVFEAVVLSSVTKALEDLGSDIYKLEWANSAVKLDLLADVA